MYYERKHFFTIVGNIKDAHEGKLDFLNTDNLGTLFNYGLVYHIQIQKELREDNEMPSIIKHYFGNLSNLMEYKDVDLNFAGKILGFNDFDNLKYSDSSELDIISSCLDHVSNSWQEELRNISDDRNLLGKKNYVPYTKDSPCSMIIIPKSCVAFCKWFEEMRQILEKEKVLAIMRYIEAIRHIHKHLQNIFHMIHDLQVHHATTKAQIGTRYVSRNGNCRSHVWERISYPKLK